MMCSSKIDQAEIQLQGRLNGNQRNRLAKLFDMMYRPSELAEEIGFAVRQIYRVYIPLGLPHERNYRNHIYINGEVFRDWYKEVFAPRKLSKNETFCLTCKKPVKIVNPQRCEKDGLVYFLSDCPNCNRKLSKIIEKHK